MQDNSSSATHVYHHKELVKQSCRVTAAAHAYFNPCFGNMDPDMDMNKGLQPNNHF